MGKEKMEKSTKIISMSNITKKKIAKVAEEINGRNLFTEKIEIAKKTLEDLKYLSI